MEARAIRKPTRRCASPPRWRRERGKVAAADLAAVKAAGYDDPQIIEIVLHVALNTWTNYVKLVADTDIDFPVVRAREAISA